MAKMVLNQRSCSRGLDAATRLASERAIKSEPDLKNCDTIMGDGDCGEAVKGVSEGRLPHN